MKTCSVGTYRNGLTHPQWWVACTVLLVNDHLLKGAGVLPGWLTGKLSDLAGLVVAPVLLVELLRARSRLLRLLCFACVAVAFAAPKLSAGAARWMEAVAAQFQVSWRLWSDPTDLVALPMLALAWWLCHRPRPICERVKSTAAKQPSFLGHAAERAAAIVGSIACVATSYNESDTGACLLNLSHEARQVQVFQLPKAPSCSTWRQDPRPYEFVAAGCFELEPFKAIPLGVPPERTATTQATQEEARCNAVVIRISGLDDMMAVWDWTKDKPPDTEECESSCDSDPARQAVVTLEAVGDRLFLTGSHVQVRPLQSPLPTQASPCTP